ncbi:glycosyltransferase family 2 protein [Granulosicoccus antarcticus]|uniref:glycosyltransferase family 2 protein n=1 Tax=Granulosicoccus antarcticus TaxID=437505 RepID=UPI0012FD0EB8|nr:glycosyltransferase family 2 protein [Granulosicoccus antarcticus]
MKTAIARFVGRCLGRAYEIRSPQPSDLTCSFSLTGADGTGPIELASQATQWELSNIRLRAGWYMLEVEHSLDSIGCVLTLQLGEAEQEYLLLSSKPVCKRIVWLQAGIGDCTVRIDQPDCSLGRLSLVALSSAFALNRMSGRLSNRGAVDGGSCREAATLYAEYQSHIHSAVLSNSYVPEEPCSLVEARVAVAADAGTELHSGLGVVSELIQASDSRSDSELALALSPDPGSIATVTLLILHGQDFDNEALASRSVTAAIAFARSVGWRIEWQSSTQFRHYHGHAVSGASIFHMQVVNDVEYRVDAFHQMMIAVRVGIDLVYADHDHIDENDIRIRPALKPEWNPELLLNTNYIQLPWMISNAWITQLETDDDSVLDTPERILLTAALGTGTGSNITLSALRDDQVIRVPKVLASLPAHRPRANDDDIRPWQGQVRKALAAAGSDATSSDGPHGGLCHVTWTLLAQLPTVDIIIPTRDKVEVLKACVDSVLEKSTYACYRLLIVDNDSEKAETQNYYESLKNISNVTLLSYAGTFNYSAINNFAVSHSDADVLVLLNNDTEVISPGWLEELVSQAMRPGVGCVGAKLYYSNGRIQHGGVIVGIAGVAGHAHRYSPRQGRGYCNRLLVSQNMTAVTAACLAVRRQTYLDAGGLDEEALQVAWNDVDFCLKVRELGYRNVWTPYAELFHHEGLSRGADDTRSKVRRVDAERQVMRARWSMDTFDDPAYHPLLTRDNESFGLA